MADYNINAVTRKVSYTGSAGVGPYAFSFEVLTETDLAVYFNATLLTLTTDYTVTINVNGTGSITIVTGTNVPTTPDADDTIVIIGARDIERTTDFVTAGDLRASSLNEQLDSLTIFDQQIDERVERSIKAPAYDPTGIDMTLPAKADRAGQVLTFDSNGDVSTSALTGLPALTIDNINIDGNTISSLSGGIIINPYSSEDAEIYDAYLRGSQITVGAPFKDVAGNTTMVLGTTRQSLYYSNTLAMRTEEGGAELFGSDNTFGGRIILTSTVAQNAIVDDDIAGSVVFQGFYPKPSGVSSDFVYSTIESVVTDATTGSVSSQLNFKVAAQDTAKAVTLSLFGGSTSATGPAITFGGGSLSSDPSGTGGAFSIQPSLGKISFAGNPTLTFGGRTLTQGSIYSEGDFAASQDGHLNLTNEYDFNKSIPIPLVQLFRDNATPAAADKLGKISFRANDSLGNKTEYANIAVDLDDPTNGSEDGSLRFEVMQGGTVSTAMEIDAAGVTIPGNLTVQGATITVDSASAQTVDLGDNDKIRLGDGDDLQIYHDGTDSYISNATGGLKLSGSVEVDDTDNLRIRFLNNDTFKGGIEVATDAGDMIGTSTVDDLAIRSQSDIRFSTGGNTERFRIEDTGIDVTGTVTADGLTVDGGDIILRSDSTLDDTQFIQFQNLESPARRAYIKAEYEDHASGTQTDLVFATNSAGSDAVERLRIANNGDISFYEDTGTTAKFFWDASAESLGINTTSPNVGNASVGHGVITLTGTASSQAGILELQAPNQTLDARALGLIRFYNGTNENARIESRSEGAVNDAGNLQFETRSTGGSLTERMRIDSSGNVGIGTTPPAWDSGFGPALHVGTAACLSTRNTDLRTQLASNAYVASPPADKYITNGYATAYLQVSGEHRWYNAPSGTANASITFTQAMTLDASGNLLVSKTSANYNTVGSTLYASGTGEFVRDNGVVLNVNRKNGDGTLISFFESGAGEGSITVSGSTVSYNGGHLARWSRLADDSKDTSIVKGTVMTNLDAMVEWSHDAVEAVEAQDAVYDDDGNVVTEAVEAVEARDAYTEDNEQLNKMAVSSVEGDPNVAGVFVNWDDDDDFNDMNIAMTGDMVIRIAQGTTVERGDLLMSAGDGTAKPQGDDIVRSKTIAKVTSTHVSHTYDDGSYLVPCVLMAC